MFSTSRIPCLCVCLITIGLSGCGDDVVAASGGTSTETGTSETGLDESGGMEQGDGDGDGDPGDGDGDPGDGDGDPGDGDGDPGDGDGDGDGDDPDLDCLDAMFASGVAPGPGYDGLGLTIGSHCQGTNHQAIEGVERVVFIGDSVTVGSPPTPTEDFYRSLLADELAFLFDIVAPNVLWKTADPFNGTALVEEDGDFASCAEWGARTDDFLRGGNQLANCFEGDDFNKRTLIVTTMGGNDVAAIAKDSLEGVAEDATWADVESMLDQQRQMVHWFLDDPTKFPNGVFIVFANVYEFTDATADLLSCPAAGLAGFDANPSDPTLLTDIMAHINIEFATLAAETSTDVVFMFEGFCGHGFHADDPASVCYRGPGQETWFDLTCIHPSPTGHHELASMFLNVISE
jgi:lysophospholipase L1-like esterase